ncbi:hypothetical protein Tph_c28610 [Thermacetogenium phaeum DSM 12270]|uniref:Uncharacterized protein n=1 Tax=Thermacetogenium phaeum (strain ATCC BAA-254 / DSM 26808 / PB) TaxID=1089553 RepID=K4LJ50_THEPS|nr:hypothetical protein [Thermacetogenium phaeum]AFV13026.1 hypothetical protein Tph_c28610 [Thermacetogenium phaeum DSM 12270]
MSSYGGREQQKTQERVYPREGAVNTRGTPERAEPFVGTKRENTSRETG